MGQSVRHLLPTQNRFIIKLCVERSCGDEFFFGRGSGGTLSHSLCACIWQTVFEDRHIAACVIRTFYSGDGLLQETSDESVGCLCWLQGKVLLWDFQMFWISHCFFANPKF